MSITVHKIYHSASRYLALHLNPDPNPYPNSNSVEEQARTRGFRWEFNRQSERREGQWEREQDRRRDIEDAYNSPTLSRTLFSLPSTYLFSFFSSPGCYRRYGPDYYA
eukprot:1392525-Amorphochlora_amoeboformis.AAC.1